MKILDLFCGGGGASLGFKFAGYEVVGIDLDTEAIALYQHNVGRGICADVTQLNPVDFEGFDCLFASPPCQQWSAARDSSLPSRDDAEVGAVVVRWLEVIQPQIFLMENVPRYQNSESYRAIVSCLSRLGYLWDESIINMAEWGIPQTRTRLILRAYRNSLLPPFPPPVRKRGWDEVLDDRLAQLPATKLGVRQTQAWIDAGRPNLALVEHCGARSDQPPQIKLPGELAWTIRASLTRSGDKYPIRAVVGGNPVKLGMREMARLCTFPDDYSFAEYRASAIGRVLGNAVPPEFAKILVSL